MTPAQNKVIARLIRKERKLRQGMMFGYQVERLKATKDKINKKLLELAEKWVD